MNRSSATHQAPSSAPRIHTRALRKPDGRELLWRRPMPYVLSIQQAPAKGTHPYAHVHIEIDPWLCRPDRPTYLAATEVAAGAFTVDTLPEATAAELRGVGGSR